MRIHPKGRRIAKAINGERPRRDFLSMLRSFPKDEAARRLRQKLTVAWRVDDTTTTGATGEAVVSDPRECGEIETIVGHVDSMTTEEPGSPAEIPGSIVVERYSDIGIGIHNEEFYLFVRCPAIGETVRLRDGKKLDLRGKRWRIVLNVFAQSTDGKTTRKSDLIERLGYKQSVGIPETWECAVQDAELTEKAGRLLRVLSKTMADLGRKFRDLVAERQESSKPIFDGIPDIDFYILLFPVRFILTDENHHLCFGWPS